jgi:hypothetical protein
MLNHPAAFGDDDGVAMQLSGRRRASQQIYCANLTVETRLRLTTRSPPFPDHDEIGIPRAAFGTAQEPRPIDRAAMSGSANTAMTKR